jgi:predicted lipoprotein
MKLERLKINASNYFRDTKEEDVTLAGLTRALRIKEGDLEKFLKEEQGRRALLKIYLKLADILELQAYQTPNQARRDVLKAVNKFVGGLYSHEETQKEKLERAKQTMAGIDSKTKKKLMEAISNRHV